MSQQTFARYEYKYRISSQQYAHLKLAMASHMKLDQFGKHTINNIYFDTADFLLIRRSLEKPVYKEKLRVRWYGARTDKTPIYIELKKKYKGVVYKRRIKRSWGETRGYFEQQLPLPQNEEGQITKELDYFMDFYQNLAPALFLGYEREAYYGVENKDFRMTFDGNIRCEQSDIYQQENNGGTRVIGRDEVLLEVKTGEGLPSWLLEFFAQEKIYRSSFSKYGTAYREILLPKSLGGDSAIA
ncbi:MAG: polyphosphate polymerase domain-containing protein [Eubacteriales bacterium]